MKKIYDWFKSLPYYSKKIGKVFFNDNNLKKFLKGIFGVFLILVYIDIIFLLFALSYNLEKEIIVSVAEFFSALFMLIVSFLFLFYSLSLANTTDMVMNKIKKVDFKKGLFIKHKNELYLYVGKEKTNNKEENYFKIEKRKFDKIIAEKIVIVCPALIILICITYIFTLRIINLYSIIILISPVVIIITNFSYNKKINKKIKELKKEEKIKQIKLYNVLGYKNYISDKPFLDDDTFKIDIIRKIEYNKIPILLNGKFGVGKSYFVDNELSKFYNIKKIELHKSGYKHNLFYYVFKELNIKRNIFETLTDNIISIWNNPTLLKYYLVMLIPMLLYVIPVGKNSSEVTTNYQMIVIFIAVILPLIITILLPYFLVNESDFSIYYRDIYLRNIKASINPIQDLIVFEDIDRIDENAFYELESIVNFMLGEKIKIILLGDYDLIKKYSKYDGKENYFEKFFEIYDLEVPEEKFADVLIDNLPLDKGLDYVRIKFDIKTEDFIKDVKEKLEDRFTDEEIENYLSGRVIRHLIFNEKNKDQIEKCVKNILRDKVKNIIKEFCEDKENKEKNKIKLRTIIQFCEYEQTSFVNSNLEESLKKNIMTQKSDEEVSKY